jgi:hypothetical protein
MPFKLYIQDFIVEFSIKYFYNLYNNYSNILNNGERKKEKRLLRKLLLTKNIDFIC